MTLIFLKNNKKVIMIIVIIFFVVIDRLLKVLSLNYFNIKPIKLIGDFFTFNLSPNYYIALSLPLRGIFLNIIIFGIIIFLIYYFVLVIKRKEALRLLFFFMIILGAASNFCDRVLYGFVIDYLDLKYFTAFNLADVMIVSGIMGLLIAIKNKA